MDGPVGSLAPPAAHDASVGSYTATRLPGTREHEVRQKGVGTPASRFLFTPFLTSASPRLSLLSPRLCWNPYAQLGRWRGTHTREGCAGPAGGPGPPGRRADGQNQPHLVRRCREHVTRDPPPHCLPQPPDSSESTPVGRTGDGDSHGDVGSGLRRYEQFCRWSPSACAHFLPPSLSPSLPPCPSLFPHSPTLPSFLPQY